MDKVEKDRGQVLQLEAGLQPPPPAPIGLSAGGHPVLVPRTESKHRSSLEAVILMND